MNSGAHRLQLFLTPPHPCSYLPQRSASTLFVDPETALDTPIYSQLVRQGFRRSGNHVYHPRCEACSACQSSRVSVRDFQPRRGQRRILKLNDSDIRLHVTPAIHQLEHYDLFLRYMAHRHPAGDMARMTPQQYIGFLGSDWCETEFIEFRLEGRLIAVAVTDRVSDGLSSVYTFFEPELPQRALGVYAILSQIRLARERGLDWVYLGYWIADCPKMRYKTDYRPLELFSEGRWQAHNPGMGVG